MQGEHIALRCKQIVNDVFAVDAAIDGLCFEKKAASEEAAAVRCFCKS